MLERRAINSSQPPTPTPQTKIIIKPNIPSNTQGKPYNYLSKLAAFGSRSIIVGLLINFNHKILLLGLAIVKLQFEVPRGTLQKNKGNILVNKDAKVYI